jgi:NitT/TauT family transport system ATP-binding protein
MLATADTCASPTITVRGVGRRFAQPDGGALRVLEDVSFVVNPGEVVAIVGPNGAGKTSLLRVLAGVDRPDAGDVEVAAPSSNRAAVAMVPQDYADSLLPWRTNLDNAALALEVAGVRTAARRLLALSKLRDWRLPGIEGEDLLTQLGIPCTAYPYALSGGQRQWVAIVRAFLSDGAAVVLDEPFAALDFHHRIVAQERLAQLHERAPVATVLVSHELDEAVHLADRVLVLSRRPGRVVAELAIDLPRPRAPLAELISDTRFDDLHRALRAAFLEALRT